MEAKLSFNRIKTALPAFEKKVRAFTYTDWYLILVCFIVFTAWIGQSAIWGFTGLILLTCFVLLTADDILPLTINIFAAVLMIYKASVEEFLYLWPLLIPLVFCIVFFAIRNFKRDFHLGKMFFPQLAVTLALLLGGVGIVSSADYVRAMPTVMFLGFGVLMIYVLFNIYLKKDNKRDIALFFAKVMMYIGIVVCLELIIVIVGSKTAPSEWHTTYWDVGWGNRNNIATYLLFTAPMCLYLSTRYKHSWLYLIIGLFQYACLVMTFSRGGIIFGFVGGVCAAVFSIVKSPNKKRALISWGIVALCALIAYLSLMSHVNDMIRSLLARGTGTSGRDILYKEGWALFKQHPFQGVGMGYIGTGPSPITEMNMYLFHSTFFQVLANMGLVGIVCYGWYYAVRCKILFKNIKNKFNLFMLVVWIGFEGYSMIDTGTMIPFPNMVLIIIGVLLLEKLGGTTAFEGIVDKNNSTLYYTKKLFGTVTDDETVPNEENDNETEASNTAIGGEIASVAQLDYIIADDTLLDDTGVSDNTTGT